MDADVDEDEAAKEESAREWIVGALIDALAAIPNELVARAFTDDAIVGVRLSRSYCNDSSHFPFISLFVSGRSRLPLLVECGGSSAPDSHFLPPAPLRDFLFFSSDFYYLGVRSDSLNKRFCPQPPSSSRARLPLCNVDMCNIRSIEV